MTGVSAAYPLRIRRSHLVSLLFVLGVLSQNVQLLPVGSEYQPLIYCAVLPLALFFAWMGRAPISQNRLLVGFIFGVALLLLLALAITQAPMVSVKDSVRVLSFPLVAVATWVYLREVSSTAVRIAVYLHVAILSLAVVSPEAATAVSGAFGSRGQSYYLGWNSYFYSEPSYAALSFLFLGFFLARTGPLRVMDTLMLAALLASTLSVTGVFGAAIMLGTFVWQRSKIAFAAACATAALGAVSVSFIPPDTPVRTLQRLAGLVEALDRVKGAGASSVLLILNTVEPSGMWRVSSNLYAMSCMGEAPLGFGNTDVFAVIGRSECSDFLGSVLRQNPTLRRLGPGASAQSVLGNLALFAGVPGVFMGLVLVCVQLAAFRHAYVVAILPLALALILFFVIWQSAWAAPAASLVIAAACNDRRSMTLRKEGQFHG